MWKEIEEYEDYLVSDCGKVKSIKFNKDKILSPTITGAGYYQVTLFNKGKRKSILVHHLVFDTFSELKRDGRNIMVDHIDNNKLNNHINNLQLLNNRENSSKDKKGYTSKYVGVHYNKENKKWKAEIYANGKNNYLGYYNSEKEAAKAYNNYLKTIQK